MLRNAWTARWDLSPFCVSVYTQWFSESPVTLTRRQVATIGERERERERVSEDRGRERGAAAGRPGAGRPVSRALQQAAARAARAAQLPRWNEITVWLISSIL